MHSANRTLATLAILASIALAGLLNSCGDSQSGQARLLRLLTGPTLVFLENENTDDGLFAGRFGDVHVFDLAHKSTLSITDDNYFDLSPSLSFDGQFLYFLSARIPGTLAGGVSAPTHIYRYEAATGLTSRFSPFRKDHLKDKEHSYECLATSRVNPHVAMVRREQSESRCIAYVYDEAKDTTYYLGLISPGTPLSMAVDDSVVVLFYFGGIRVISIRGNASWTLDEDDMNYLGGDIRGDTLLYIRISQYRGGHPDSSRIELMSMRTRERQTLFALPFSSGMADVCFGDDRDVYFVRNDVESGNAQSRQIFKLNLQSNDLTRITSGPAARDFLKYWRPPK